MPDVLWRQAGTGVIAEWQMGAAGIAASGPIGTLDAGWAFQGVGSFAGDGTTQVLWKGPGGTIVEWTVQGFQVTGGAAVGTLDSSWTHVG